MGSGSKEAEGIYKYRSKEAGSGGAVKKNTRHKKKHETQIQRRHLEAVF
tara:strand:- start:294 stop:440 length:147 start_codon:yes stop_codon:yes gene_type:complete